MTLRDHFAGQALAAIYFDSKLGDDALEAADMARLAFLVADEMLKARAK